MKATILLLTEEGVKTSTNVRLEMEAVTTHALTRLVRLSVGVVKVTNCQPMEKHVKVCMYIGVTIMFCMTRLIFYCWS